MKDVIVNSDGSYTIFYETFKVTTLTPSEAVIKLVSLKKEGKDE